jgi:hypothetical protein
MRQTNPPNLEFLPLSAAPTGCSFKLMADILAENGLLSAIDLLAVLKSGLNPAVYTTEGGEMLGDPGAWRLGLDIVATNHEVAAERAATSIKLRRGRPAYP